MTDLATVMLDHCAQMLLLVDPNTLQIVKANAPVASTLGYTLEQLHGMPITEVESDLQDGFYWEDVRAGQHQDVQGQEGEYRCANGEMVAVNKSVQRVQHDGATLLLVQAVVARDERQAQDALAHTLSQLRATLESTGNGILVLNWQGRIDGMNQLFGKMWRIPDELQQMHDDARLLDFIAASVVETELFRARLGAVVDGRETLDLLHH